MVPFVVFTFLNTNDFGVFASSYTIVYFVLRLVFNPRLRLKVDVLGLFLLVVLVLSVAQHVLAVLGGH
jgi:hypothetical protein